KRFYNTACCFLDLSTYLDETSATAIYTWSCSEMSAEEDVLRYHARRILGLRCHVAMWGAAREQQPDSTSMDDLLRACRNAYEEAKPLSAQLAWSEEGLFDGYITAALNIVLHAYHATRDLGWVEKGSCYLREWTVSKTIRPGSFIPFALLTSWVLQTWRRVAS
ncbi:putative N-alpha-acetyltransferase 25, NatB auxiliary subunit isoform X1, partial [Trypanosoma cruzi]